MQRHHRLSAVLELVAQRASLTVDDVAAEFGISTATARRDLDELADQLLVTRTRGGVVAHSKLSYNLPLRYRVGTRSDDKQRIAAAAVELVQAGAVIGLNGGTTTTEVARQLAMRPDLTAPDTITVVTNALNIANELAVRPQVRVVVVGGVLRPQSFELVGPFAARVLDDVALDLTLMGVEGLTAEHGASAAHPSEADIDSRLAAYSRRVVVVADSSKLGRRAFCTICRADAIDTVITDAAADPDETSKLREAGVDVRVV